MVVFRYPLIDLAALNTTKKKIFAFLGILFMISYYVNFTFWRIYPKFRRTNVSQNLTPKHGNYTIPEDIPITFEVPEKVVLQPPRTICEQIYLLIIVTSHAANAQVRNAHRTAMSIEYLRANNASRIFMLAKIPENVKTVTQKDIENESEVFEDILQGSFVEDYKNLTLKHLMGLKWASQCDTAFILKIDDDTVFILNRAFKYLSSDPDTKSRDDFLVGYLEKGSPIRFRDSKWYVAWEEYSKLKYPMHLAGFYYFLTPEVAKKLIEVAPFHRYFWVDDVFITGVLAKSANITPKMFRNYTVPFVDVELECCVNYMLNNVSCEDGNDLLIGLNCHRYNLITDFTKAVAYCEMNGCFARFKEALCVWDTLESHRFRKSVTSFLDKGMSDLGIRFI